MKKALSLLRYVLLAIGLITVILVMANGEASVGLMLTWAYILLGLAIVAAVVFPLLNLASNPKGAMRTLLGVGVVVVVLVVTYALGSSEPIRTPVDTFNNPTVLKLSDMGLYTGYIALFGAIVVAIFGEIRNSFK